MKPLMLFLALSWLQAGTPANKSNKVRPKPIEPDVSTNGGFRAPVEPSPVQIMLPPPPQVEAKVIPPEKTPVIPDKMTWRPDASGNYWSKGPDGREYYSTSKESLIGYGEQINK